MSLAALASCLWWRYVLENVSIPTRALAIVSAPVSTVDGISQVRDCAILWLGVAWIWNDRISVNLHTPGTSASDPDFRNLVAGMKIQ